MKNYCSVSFFSLQNYATVCCNYEAGRKLKKKNIVFSKKKKEGKVFGLMSSKRCSWESRGGARGAKDFITRAAAQIQSEMVRSSFSRPIRNEVAGLNSQQ